MTQTILAFGDSNTHGTPPMHDHNHHPRLPRRWPVVMAEIIGCNLIEDALPGRTACQLNPTTPDAHMDGNLGLRMALAMHGPIDQLLIMLGTNDMQFKYGQTVEAITSSIAWLLAMANDPETQARHGGFATTLICPPAVMEIGTFVPGMYGAVAKSAALSSHLAPLAAAHGVSYLDAGLHISPSPIDGVHFDAETHEILGKAIAAHLQAFVVQ